MGDIEKFNGLVVEAIDELRKLPSPAARLSGPLRTGGDGYETNLARFQLGEELLRSRGFTVFGYHGKYADAIKAAYDLHFEHFHIPILKSGLIVAIYFLPGWEGSGGASYERQLCEEIGISIGDISREELLAFEATHRGS